ncbi:hypothetical protein NQT65_19175 [Pseudoalteromonas agarivorans]|uniref:hypothetical protein n=1 Tax=Pseudoalteromonas agarivorans TaxID=176102 RepID=UPI002117CB47|nr:hypothetical protein [Pseudoalteromonas agarivorans]MCQ8822317.1 hypothetical protein [Pseudoalteromonas agarivorans]
MSNTKYIVDANAPISNYYATESIIYTDLEGVERVAYSGALYLHGALDMTWPEYKKYMADIKPEISLKVIDSEEQNARINLYRQEQMKEEKEISSEDYWWLLECLPPCRWRKVSGVELFHVSERICLDLVQWVGQIGDKYYKLVDSEKAELSDIAERFINLDKTLAA